MKSKLQKIIILAVLAVLVSSWLVYLDSWPPMTVVSSGSMQHSSQWTYNSINTGDMVFIKHVTNPQSQIVTYVNGSSTSYSTYGEYGNVIIYRAPDGTDIIHRAMFYLSWKAGHPEVSGYHNQSWIKITDSYILLKDVGYSHRNALLYLSLVRNQSGFITMGDHNLATASPMFYNASLNAYSVFDQDGILGIGPDPPVNASEVVGVAVGEIPWVGLVKLNIDWYFGLQKQENPVPFNSYVYLSISLAAVLIFSYALDRRKK